MENSSCRKRYLMTTAHAFKQTSGRNSPISPSAALRAAKSIWPTSTKKPVTAIALNFEFLVEIDPTHLTVIWFVNIKFLWDYMETIRVS